MEEQVLFTEKQWFIKQWWFYGLFGLILVLTLAHLTLRYEHLDTGALLIGAGIPLFVLVVFLGCFHLTTQITTQGIQIAFFPFVFYNKNISWQEVKSASVIKIHTFREFGGAGVRFRGWGFKAIFNKDDMGYIVSGTTGLQLELTDGKKVYVGTKKEVEIQKILKDKGFSK